MTGPDYADDYSSAQGAATLKKRLEAFWSERGYSVQVFVRSAGFHAAIRARRFEIQSDMVNGFPRDASAPP